MPGSEPSSRSSTAGPASGRAPPPARGHVAVWTGPLVPQKLRLMQAHVSLASWKPRDTWSGALDASCRCPCLQLFSPKSSSSRLDKEGHVSPPWNSRNSFVSDSGPLPWIHPLPALTLPTPSRAGQGRGHWGLRSHGGALSLLLGVACELGSFS